MSGGLAFVLDEDDTFAARCNLGMIGVEALDASDEIVVRALLEEHVARTASVRGTELLARWAAVRTRFKKVIPTEYKRVLEQQRVAEPVAAPAGPRLLKLVKS